VCVCNCKCKERIYQFVIFKSLICLFDFVQLCIATSFFYSKSREIPVEKH